MTLGTTAIEYILNPDGTPGRIWNPVSGCAHGLDVCAIADRCWARAAAKRHHWDFTPKLHPEVLYDPVYVRKPSTIAVGWAGMSGDMWGEWWRDNPDWRALLDDMLNVVRLNIRHTFLFLTKNPGMYSEFGPWPSNAWLGASITGAESAEVQRQRLEALLVVEGGWNDGHPVPPHKWVSYEPALGELLALSPFAGIEWVVAGGLSGRRGDKGMLDRCCRARAYAYERGIPVWLKSGLFAKGAVIPPGWQQRPQEMKHD